MQSRYRNLLLEAFFIGLDNTKALEFWSDARGSDPYYADELFAEIKIYMKGEGHGAIKTAIRCRVDTEIYSWKHFLLALTTLKHWRHDIREPFIL
jgi:hypothetical protein